MSWSQTQLVQILLLGDTAWMISWLKQIGESGS